MITESLQENWQELIFYFLKRKIVHRSLVVVSSRSKFPKKMGKHSVASLVESPMLCVLVLLIMFGVSMYFLVYKNKKQLWQRRLSKLPTTEC